jgi:hypothetical protein
VFEHMLSAGGGGGTFPTTTPVDADPNVDAVITAARSQLWDSELNSWWLERCNLVRIILPGAIRNATTTSAVFRMISGRALVLVARVDLSPGVQTLTFSLRSEDTGTPINIGQIAPTAFAAGQQTSLAVGQGAALGWLGGTASTARNTPPPINYSVQVAHSGAGLWDYEVIMLELR